MATVQKIETKVIAATAGGGLGAAVGQFALWLLAVVFWHASNSADAAGDAIGKVPSPVAVLVTVLIAVVGVFVGGYAAPHTDGPTENADAGSTGQPDMASYEQVVSAGVPAKSGQAVLADQSAALAASTPVNDNNGVLPADYDWASAPTDTTTGATA